MLKSGDTPEKNFMVTKIARLNIEKNWSEKKNCRKEKYVEKKKQYRPCPRRKERSEDLN